MEVPRCPDPAHARSRVTRAGRYGKAPHRRQRWLCRPLNGDQPHRFSELLPRRQAEHEDCLECSTALEAWEGQNGPREYLFAAREVAHALALAARGESYARAARAARRLGRRIRPGNRIVGGRRRNSNYDGQIVANWVDVFGPVITADLLPDAWPARLAVDSRRWVTTNQARRRAGMGFHVFAAVGYATLDSEPRVWKLTPYPRRTGINWRSFFSQLEGRPRMIVSDMAAEIRNGIAAAWPAQAGKRAPEHRLCEHHLAESLRQGIPASALAQPNHPVTVSLPYALQSPGGWARFEQAVKIADRTQNPAMPGTLRWINNYGAIVRAQTQTRRIEGPNSTGAAETTLERLGTAFRRRSYLFTNQRRTARLLDLITLGLNGDVDELAWAEKVRSYLLQRAGIAPEQRQDDDPVGAWSLLA